MKSSPQPPFVPLTVSAVAMFHQQCWHKEHSAEVWIPAIALHHIQRYHFSKGLCVTRSTDSRHHSCIRHSNIAVTLYSIYYNTVIYYSLCEAPKTHLCPAQTHNFIIFRRMHLNGEHQWLIKSVSNPQSKRSGEFEDFFLLLLFNQKRILLTPVPRNEVRPGAEFQSVVACQFSLGIVLRALFRDE